jgi:hypothetical protein
LDNALYYGKRAEISTRAESGVVAIAVRDHGPGVPEDALASLFDPYMRLEHGREQNDNGMGLGLGIARGVIEAHGGKLILENHPEGGLHATIRLLHERDDENSKQNICGRTGVGVWRAGMCRARPCGKRCCGRATQPLRAEPYASRSGPAKCAGDSAQSRPGGRPHQWRA